MPRGWSEEGVQLGRRLAVMRRQADLTQQAVAFALGIGERTYQAWEAGQRIPRYHNRVKLAALYGGSPADFLPGDEERLASIEQRLAAIEAALELDRPGAIGEAAARLLAEVESPAPPAPDRSSKPRRVRRPRSA